MDASNKEPSAAAAVGAVTNLQLRRYDDDSIMLVKAKLEEWARVLSTPEHPVKTHLMGVSIQDVPNPDILAFLNGVPTGFKLSDEQVDKLIETGRTLLRNNPTFIELVKDLNGG